MSLSSFVSEATRLVCESDRVDADPWSRVVLRSKFGRTVTITPDAIVRVAAPGDRLRPRVRVVYGPGVRDPHSRESLVRWIRSMDTGSVFRFQWPGPDVFRGYDSADVLIGHGAPGVPHVPADLFDSLTSPATLPRALATGIGARDIYLLCEELPVNFWLRDPLPEVAARLSRVDSFHHVPAPEGPRPSVATNKTEAMSRFIEYARACDGGSRIYYTDERKAFEAAGAFIDQRALAADRAEQDRKRRRLRGGPDEVVRGPPDSVVSSPTESDADSVVEESEDAVSVVGADGHGNDGADAGAAAAAGAAAGDAGAPRAPLPYCPRNPDTPGEAPSIYLVRHTLDREEDAMRHLREVAERLRETRGWHAFWYASGRFGYRGYRGEQIVVFPSIASDTRLRADVYERVATGNLPGAKLVLMAASLPPTNWWRAKSYPDRFSLLSRIGQVAVLAPDGRATKDDSLVFDHEILTFMRSLFPGPRADRDVETARQGERVPSLESRRNRRYLPE